MPLVMIRFGDGVSIPRYFDTVPRVGDVLIVGGAGEEIELVVDRAQHAQRPDGATMDYSVHAHATEQDAAV